MLHSLSNNPQKTEAMREIKFRAKDRSTGQWVYGYPYKSSMDNWFILTETSKYHIDEETLGQYTGFTDKNGTPIYEDDICLIRNSVKAEVKWQSGGFHLLDPTEDVSGRHTEFAFSVFNAIEVIGNIHENTNPQNQITQ